MNSVNVKKFEVDSIEYTWIGGHGVLFSSIETRKSTKNEVRSICGVSFITWSITPIAVGLKFWRWGQQKELCWTPLQKISVEWIKEFKEKLFMSGIN